MASRNPALPFNRDFPDGEPHFNKGILFVYPNCDVEPEGVQRIHIKSEESLKIKSFTVN